MERRLLLKREIALITVTTISLVLAIVSVICIIDLKRTIANNNHVQSVNSTVQNDKLNEQIGYIDTICGEYRKLYSAYKDLSAQGHSVNGIGYTLPGSAKGEIDACYQSE